MEKTFMTKQLIQIDIKRYEEIRKLIAEHDYDYYYHY